jgi:hypothetical protein
MLQAGEYHGFRLGKEGAISIYHLNYLLLESLEDFRLVRE